MQTEHRPSGRQRRSFIEEARRAQIEAAAAEVVADFGYANASLSRIAERAGISKSVISYHFDGKDDLLTRMVRSFFDETWEHMSRRIDAEPTAAGKVRAWISAEIEFFEQQRTRFLAMSDIVLNHRTADGSRPFDGATNEEAESMAALLAAGQAAGEFRDFDPHAIATVIVRCTEGLLASWAVNNVNDLPAQTEALLDFIDHAIRRSSP